MRNLMLVAAFAVLVLSPLTATAQQRPAPAPPAAPPAAAEGVTTAKVLAIGVGILLGAVAAEVIVSEDVVTLVGGVAGGLLAAWWYDNSNGGPTRAAIRARAEGSEPARTERLALAE